MVNSYKGKDWSWSNVKPIRDQNKKSETRSKQNTIIACFYSLKKQSISNSDKREDFLDLVPGSNFKEWAVHRTLTNLSPKDAPVIIEGVIIILTPSRRLSKGQRPEESTKINISS